MKKAELRDRIEALEEALAVTQKLVAEQATERSFRRAWSLGPVTGYRVPDPAETAKVGDPDPTLDDGERDCPSTDAQWGCTRSRGHAGQHVAGDNRTVCAVWPADPDRDESVKECSAQYPDDGCRCTLTAGHDGDHEAGSGIRPNPWHRWPQAADERETPGQRDRTAAIEGAAITLRAHKKSVTHSGCICGWERESTDHARHVAEQLAAVGALGDREPSPHLLVDDNGDTWHVLTDGRLIEHRRELIVWDRADIEEKYGPLKAVVHVDKEIPF